MKYLRIGLGILLLCSLVGSGIFLLYVVATRSTTTDWQAVSAELILVIVLAAEGLFAISHLAESRAERHAESLRDFIKDFASEKALQEREELFTKLPWGHDFGHIPDKEIQWLCETRTPIAVYKMQGSADCKVEVTMESETWRPIQRLCDQYHFAGLSCKRGYMDMEDLLTSIGPQPLRWWRRLGGIIRQERDRRENRALYKGFEDLASATQRWCKKHAYDPENSSLDL